MQFIYMTKIYVQIRQYNLNNNLVKRKLLIFMI